MRVKIISKVAILFFILLLKTIFCREIKEENKPEEWYKLDSLSQYGERFSEDFIDSICKAKNITFRYGLRQFDNGCYAIGEKFVYSVSWGPISAGYAILETIVEPNSQIAIISGKGYTNSFFSSIYRVRDYIRAVVDRKGIYPFFFEQHLREGKYKADRWEIFDQLNGIVFSHNNDTVPYKVPPFVQDYLSILNYIRALTFKEGDSFSVNCFVHNRSHLLTFKCLEKKPIEVDAGIFNCLLIKPILVGEGRVFTKKDEIKIWLTNDCYKMPVMAKAKIAFGSITARLIWYERDK
jgi:hypothetical protein